MDPVPTVIQLNRIAGISAAVCALVAPYLARLCAVPWRGLSWFLDYIPSWWSVPIFTAFNGIHAFVLFRLAVSASGNRAPFWAASGISILFSSVSHFVIDLRAGSTAGVAVLLTPIYAAIIAAVVSWVVGRSRAV